MGVVLWALNFTKASVINVSMTAENNRQTVRGPDGAYYARDVSPRARVFLDVVVRDPLKTIGRNALRSYYDLNYQNQLAYSDNLGLSYNVKFIEPPVMKQWVRGSQAYFYSFKFEVMNFTLSGAFVSGKWVNSTEEWQEDSQISRSAAAARYRYDYMTPKKIWKFGIINLTRAQAVGIMGLLANNFRVGSFPITFPQNYGDYNVTFDQDQMSMSADASGVFTINTLTFVEGTPVIPS